MAIKGSEMFLCYSVYCLNDDDSAMDTVRSHLGGSEGYIWSKLFQLSVNIFHNKKTCRNQ